MGCGGLVDDIFSTLLQTGAEVDAYSGDLLACDKAE